MKDNCVIEIKNVSKQYKLGVIGTGSLRRDLQSWWAKKTGKPDPNLEIGERPHKKGERFLALDNISLEISRGERVGIIGANGAGKSTLLKLLSRVTAPSEGVISYRGRITSMLEVGTGFHAELTGRENIFLKGAILGMTKSEVESKLSQIIEFSECEKFIDTPVKRYSSGMFVKLAFAVAVHLDSEIMIMDEVLAVGDMKFQKKCIEKMRSLALEQNRTVLYVSHNMNTIRRLCNRCIVLDKGKIIYDGDVDEAIKIYLGSDDGNFCFAKYDKPEYKDRIENRELDLKTVKYIGKADNIFTQNEPMLLELGWENLKDISNLSLRIEVSNYQRVPITSFLLENFYSGKAGESFKAQFKIDISNFTTGGYYTRYVFYAQNDDSQNFRVIESAKGLTLRKRTTGITKNPCQKSWGSVVVGKIELLD